MDSEPLVSAVIPVFNAEATLGETIASVCSQSYRNLEIIIVDDGSLDRSVEVAMRHAALDGRLKVITQPNGGVASARNHGIASATGELIAPVDADDLWQRDKVARQVTALQERPGLGLVYTLFSVIDERGFVQFNQDVTSPIAPDFTDLLFRNSIGNGSSAMFPKAVFDERGPYDSSLRDMNAQGCEDYALYLSIAERYPIGMIPDYLTGYRVTKDNMSSNLLTMLESRRLCMVPYRTKYPELQRVIDRGWTNFIRYLFVRAVQSGKYRDAITLLAEQIRHDPWMAAHLLLDLSARFLRRSIAGRGGSRERYQRHFLDAERG